MSNPFSGFFLEKLMPLLARPDEEIAKQKAKFKWLVDNREWFAMRYNPVLDRVEVGRDINKDYYLVVERTHEMNTEGYLVFYLTNVYNAELSQEMNQWVMRCVGGDEVRYGRIMSSLLPIINRIIVKHRSKYDQLGTENKG